MFNIGAVTIKEAAWLWQDARHQYVDTARQRRRRPVLHVVAAATATAVATARPTPRRAAEEVATAAAAVLAGPVAEQGRAGREPVRPSRTRLPKCSHSRQFANPLRRQR